MGDVSVVELGGLGLENGWRYAGNDGARGGGGTCGYDTGLFDLVGLWRGFLKIHPEGFYRRAG